MFNKKLLSIAVAASLGGFVATQANAALSTNGSELPATNVLTPTTTTWLVGLTSYVPTSSNPLYVSYSLSNGANFSTAPSLTCSTVTGSTSTPVLAAGGAGNSVATFVLTATSAAGGTVSSCTITNGAISAVNWPTGITESYSATYGGNLAPATVGSSALFAASSIFNNLVSAMSNLSPVASGFISFTGGITTAQIGNVNIVINSNIVDGGNAANSTGLSNYVTGITFSLAGAPLAGAKRVFITQTAVGPASCASTPVLSAAGATTITMSGLIPANTAVPSYAVCMSITGAVIPAGTITFGLAAGGAADGAATPATGTFQITSLFASGTTLGTITHNGASTEVVNLPPSTNADAGYLRVYNNSSLSGAVTVTVYNEAGTALATNCSLSSSLAAQGTLVTSVAALETTCGITPPATGRYRMVINGAFSSMRAQGLARTAGVLVNMSADSSSNSN